MATAKPKTAAAKSTTSKAAAKKPAVKKTVPTPKPAKAKSAQAKATKAIPGGREQQLAEQALSLVDEAAAILRARIRDGATQTAKGRLAAKKKAGTLLNRASGTLTRAVETGTSSLEKLLGKI